MKADKKFLRQCALCKEIKSKQDLIRITKDYTSGEIKINDNNKIQGRSVYLCKDKMCIRTAVRKNRIENSLKAKPDDNLIEELLNMHFLPGKIKSYNKNS